MKRFIMVLPKRRTAVMKIPQKKEIRKTAQPKTNDDVDDRYHLTFRMDPISTYPLKKRF